MDFGCILLLFGCTLCTELALGSAHDRKPRNPGDSTTISSSINFQDTKSEGTKTSIYAESESIKGDVTKCHSSAFICGAFCAPSHWRCDGQEDCPDGADEEGCDEGSPSAQTTSATTSFDDTSASSATDITNTSCENSLFDCKNGHCIMESWACDGDKDCSNGHDEVDCEEAGMFCGSDQFQCNDDICIPSIWRCDSEPDCIGGEDELCPLDETTVSSPHQDTTPLPTQETSPPEEESIGQPIPYAIFCQLNEIRKLGLNPRESLDEVLISTGRNTTALDFYYTPTIDYIFWIDLADHTISKGQLISRRLTKVQTIVHTAWAIESLAVDWMGENVYWVESGKNKQIVVAKMNGYYPRTLISKDLETPSAFALDPRVGIMFWTNWGKNPRIESASMSGEGRKGVIPASEIGGGGRPDGLALDYDNNRIYWIDAKSDSLCSANYDGSFIREILRNMNGTTHPFRLSLFERNVYWTDWDRESIFSAKKTTGSDIQVLLRPVRALDVKIVHPSRQPRAPFNPCGDNGGCSHLCLLNFNSTRQCSCPQTVALSSDNITCTIPICTYDQLPCRNGRCVHLGAFCDYVDDCGDRTDEENCADSPYAIVTQGNAIKKISLDLHEELDKVLISSLGNTIALDFYHNLGNYYIFWADSTDHKISKGQIISGVLTDIQVLVHTDPGQLEGLAIDWVGENVYWAENGHFKRIRVAKISGSYATTLISSDIGSPRAIAVDPRAGILFWTDWEDGNARIESASMSGVSRKVVINVNKISSAGWPNGLTLDYDHDRIYWIDAKSDSLHSANYDGSDIREVWRNRGGLSHAFGLSLFGSDLYFTDWTNFSIKRIKKHNGTEVQTLRKGFRKLYDIKIVHYSRQPKVKINPCANNGGCSHLCLLNFNLTRQCNCPQMMTLSSDNLTCTSKPVVTCKPDQFLCEDNRCISNSSLCDGKTDCIEGTDEKNCEGVRKCDSEQFTCKNNRCILKALVCDGGDDCLDGSDEVDCDDTVTSPSKTITTPGHAGKLCEGDEVLCKDGLRCIPKYWLCNGYPDCYDRSDERNCPDTSRANSVPSNKTQLLTPFPRCPNGFSIFKNRCLWISAYPRIWVKAEEVCGKRFSSLAEFPTDGDHSRELLEWITNQTVSGWNYWVGTPKAPEEEIKGLPQKDMEIPVWFWGDKKIVTPSSVPEYTVYRADCYFLDYFDFKFYKAKNCNDFGGMICERDFLPNN